MLAFTSDHHDLALPPGHRFPASKYALLRQRVEAEIAAIRLAPAPAASEGELALAHDPAYIQAVLDGSLAPAALREIGFPWSQRMVDRSRHSVGATIAAARAALDDGIAVNLAGGTHHARRESGSGFCVFNDVAVATRLMQAEWRERRRKAGLAGFSPLRVLVIDLDVHQGNGTAAIFSGDPSVFTLSLHGARNFPFRKVPSCLDVDLPDGCGDAEYLMALQAALASTFARMAEQPPQLAFYLAGADPHEGDRLGRLKLSLDGLKARDEIVFNRLLQAQIPVAVCMAGGYGHDIRTTVEVHVQTVHRALSHWQSWNA